MTIDGFQSAVVDGTTVEDRAFPQDQAGTAGLHDGVCEAVPDWEQHVPPTIAVADIERKLAHLGKALPLSQAAIEAHDLASLTAIDARSVADAIAPDRRLGRDLLRLAGGPHGNPLGKTPQDLEEAIEWIGPQRASSFALASSVLGAMLPNAGPWLNARLAWRRCMAAGSAVDLIASAAGREDRRESLFLSAVLHPLHRLALSVGYPGHYLAMAVDCEVRRELLDDRERQMFSIGHREVVYRTLRSWGLASRAFEPLMYCSEDYGALARLPEPLRTDVELLKLAIAVGWLAAGEWEAWDRVEVPPAYVMRLAGRASLAEIVERTRQGVRDMADFWPKPEELALCLDSRPADVQWSHAVPYRNVSGQPMDFLAEFLRSMGFDLTCGDADDARTEESTIVNCLWAYPKALERGAGERLIFTDVTHAEPCSQYGRVLVLPASYAAIRDAWKHVAQSDCV
jgi:HD-like signal output (HDOD) protein